MQKTIRNMIAADNFKQRVHIAQNRTVEAAPIEARTGERDLLSESARKVRFTERVEQISEDTVGDNSRNVSSSPSSSSSSFPSSSQKAIAPSTQIDENNEDRSKKKVIHDAGKELERYSDCDFLMQAKQKADIYFDNIFSNDHQKKKTVEKLIQSGVHVAEVFSSPRTARLVHRFGLTPGLAFDLRTGRDLNDPARNAKILFIFVKTKSQS